MPSEKLLAHRRILYNVEKTRSLIVHEFVPLLRYHNKTIVPRLPGAPDEDASYNDDEIKDIVFNSMP